MLLTEKRPLKTPFVFGGRSFLINMAFNTILTVLEILDDEELLDVERAMMALYFLTSEEEFSDPQNLKSQEELIFVEGLLKEIFDKVIIDDTAKKAVRVDLLGNPLPVMEEEDEDEERSFDYTHDAAFIYASFMQAYQIDLYEKHDQMNWETFIALFNGLPAETIMAKVIDIRTKEIPKGKGTQKEAEQIRKAKRNFALPD